MKKKRWKIKSLYIKTTTTECKVNNKVHFWLSKTKLFKLPKKNQKNRTLTKTCLFVLKGAYFDKNIYIWRISDKAISSHRRFLCRHIEFDKTFRFHKVLSSPPTFIVLCVVFLRKKMICYIYRYFKLQLLQSRAMLCDIIVDKWLILFLPPFDKCLWIFKFWRSVIFY